MRLKFFWSLQLTGIDSTAVGVNERMAVGEAIFLTLKWNASYALSPYDDLLKANYIESIDVDGDNKVYTQYYEETLRADGTGQYYRRHLAQSVDDDSHHKIAADVEPLISNMSYSNSNPVVPGSIRPKATRR